jgi:hypothetical protein
MVVMMEVIGNKWIQTEILLNRCNKTDLLAIWVDLEAKAVQAECHQVDNLKIGHQEICLLEEWVCHHKTDHHHKVKTCHQIKIT